MKAAVFKGPGKGLRIEELPDPAPEAGEVVIRVGRVGICGSDLSMTSGEGQQLATDSVIGHEFCGEVVALGTGVDNLHLGDRVAPLPFVGCGHCPACYAGYVHRCQQLRVDIVAGYAQYSRVGARDCVQLSETVSDEEGALIEPLAVGLQGVRKAALPVGAKVLVVGAGPIGLSAAFWAQRLGASRIAVVAQSARRSSVVATMGFGKLVAQGEASDPQQAIADVLGGMPDVVFEAAGVPGAIARAIEYVKLTGTVIGLGIPVGVDSFVPALAVWKEVRVQFSMCYNRQDFAYAEQIIAAGDHRPRAMISATISLDRLPDKFESLRGHTSECKVMVAPNGL